MDPPSRLLVRELADLARTAPDIRGFGAAVCAAVARAVPHDASCFTTADPDTGLLGEVVRSPCLDGGDEALAHYEYGMDDVNPFRVLARRRLPVGLLHRDTRGRPEECARFREYLGPGLGFTDEARVVFRAAGLTWGTLALYRSSGVFDGEDGQVLGAANPVVPTGISRLLRAGVSPPARMTESAVLVVGSDGRPARTSAGAGELLRRFGGSSGGTLPLPVLSAVAQARRSDSGEAVRARLRLADGSWVRLHAVALDLGDGDSTEVVVTLDPSGPEESTTLRLSTLGLTARETQVAELVVAGLSTEAIARRLDLSRYTVQDHLKSVFAKAGVRSRRELVAAIRSA